MTLTLLLQQANDRLNQIRQELSAANELLHNRQIKIASLEDECTIHLQTIDNLHTMLDEVKLQLEESKRENKLLIQQGQLSDHQSINSRSPSIFFD